jgi:hypothetical protein
LAFIFKQGTGGGCVVRIFLICTAQQIVQVRKYDSGDQTNMNEVGGAFGARGERRGEYTVLKGRRG